MSDLTDHVADALFTNDIDPDRFSLGRNDCGILATVALRAARAQGWRIVKLDDSGYRDAGDRHWLIDEEWTG